VDVSSDRAGSERALPPGPASDRRSRLAPEWGRRREGVCKTACNLLGPFLDKPLQAALILHEPTHTWSQRLWMERQGEGRKSWACGLEKESDNAAQRLT
jgi:hypothetical protein